MLALLTSRKGSGRLFPSSTVKSKDTVEQTGKVVVFYTFSTCQCKALLFGVRGVKYPWASFEAYTEEIAI